MTTMQLERPEVAPPPSRSRSGRSAPAVATMMQEWVLPATRGDEEAITRLLALLRPVVVRYCRARLSGAETGGVNADDVAQEVCIAVCHALPRYHYGDRLFLGFVYGIAAHKVADVRRAAARSRTNPVPEVPERADDTVGPLEAAVARERQHWCSELLSTLSPEHRQIVVLRIVLGYSAQQVADMIGSTPGAVRVAQHRAVTKLRAALDGRSGSSELPRHDWLAPV